MNPIHQTPTLEEEGIPSGTIWPKTRSMAVLTQLQFVAIAHHLNHRLRKSHGVKLFTQSFHDCQLMFHLKLCLGFLRFCRAGKCLPGSGFQIEIGIRLQILIAA